MAKEQITLRLSPDVKARLEEKAEADERSVSWLVEKALQRYFEGSVSDAHAPEAIVSETPAVNIDPMAPPEEDAVWAALATTGRWDDGWIPLPPNTSVQKYITAIEKRQAALGKEVLRKGSPAQQRHDELAQQISRLRFLRDWGSDPKPRDPEIVRKEMEPYSMQAPPTARSVGGSQV